MKQYEVLNLGVDSASDQERTLNAWAKAGWRVVAALYSPTLGTLIYLERDNS